MGTYPRWVASIETRGNSHRVIWRYRAEKQTCSWPTIELAEEARGIVEARRHQMTQEQLYAAMGVPGKSDAEPATPTLRVWGDGWLSSRTRITPGQLARYRQQAEVIYQEFGDTPIGDITAITVGTWINKMRDRPGKKVGSKASPKTVTRYFSLLSAMLKAAADQGVISFNPCGATDFVRDQRADDDQGEHHAVYLTPVQYEILRAAFPAKWHTLLDALIETGCRWGEISALAKRHLVGPTEKAAARIRVWRAWKRGKGGERYLGTTKGRQKRSIPISTELYHALLALVDDLEDDAFLWRRADGTALDYSEMYNDVWVPGLVAARRCVAHPPPNRGEVHEGATGRCRDFGGVTDLGEPCGARVTPGRTRCASHFGPASRAVSTCGCPSVLTFTDDQGDPSWHDLRHTFAAWCFSDPRMTVLAISRLLGHATLAITSDVYGDLMPDAEETVVDAIADARRAGRAGRVPTGRPVAESRPSVRQSPRRRTTTRRAVVRTMRKPG